MRKVPHDKGSEGLKKNTKRTLIGLATFFLLLSAAIFAAYSSRNKDELKPIVILHTNDLHGAFSSVDTTTGKPSETVIGHDLIRSKYLEYQKKGPTFLLDAGDAVQGDYFVTENKGEAAIDILNATGYDAVTLGNHEFDYGWLRLAKLIGEADFPFLSQIADTDTDAEKIVKPYTIITRKDAALGVFGITTPETAYKSDGAFGKDFGTTKELIAHAKEMVSTLKEQGADYIVCLSHLGTETGAPYASAYDIRDNVPGIDVIIDGHTHTQLADIKNVEGKTQITSTGSNGEGLGVVKLYREGNRTEVSLSTLSKEDFKGVKKDAAVSDILDTWSAKVSASGSTPVASVPFDITVDRESERTKETVMGNITTDAMREVSGADIAMQNGGSIRNQHLTAGEITTGEILTIFPYGNIIQMAEVPGSAILEVLEHSVSEYPEACGGFMQVSGLSYTFNPGAPVGSRIRSVIVGNTPLDPDKTYTLCTNDFIAYGGDEYEMLRDYFDTQLPLRMPDYASLDQAVIYYLTTHYDALVNQTEGRIVAVK